LLNGNHYRKVSVTTDGIIIDADPGKLHFDPFWDMPDDFGNYPTREHKLPPGPIADAMIETRKEISGTDEFIETKYEMARVFPWITRGITTIETANGSKPKVARGGIQTPRGVDADKWLLNKLMSRQPGGTFTVEEPLPFPKAHKAASDHRFIKNEKKLSMEFDMKRKPVNPRMVAFTMPDGTVVEHLAFDTVPWGSVDEFDAVKKQWDRWRRNHVLKTLDDWADWQAFGRLADVQRLKAA
jgi:hypothetical protein